MLCIAVTVKRRQQSDSTVCGVEGNRVVVGHLQMRPIDRPVVVGNLIESAVIECACVCLLPSVCRRMCDESAQ